MSLVNSLINQIGREMGRDIYWTTRQSLTQSYKSNASRKSAESAKRRDLPEQVNIELDSNQVILSEISKAQLASISSQSLRCHEIEKLLGEMENSINPKSFNWREAYVSMDNVLDDLKFKVSKDELPEIEKFDRRNLAMFHISNNQHRRWVDLQIQQLKQSPYYGYSPLSTASLIGWSIVGLASIPLNRRGINRAAEFIAAMLWISAAIFVFNAKDFIGAERPIVIAVGFCALMMFLIILSGNFILRAERDSMVNFVNSRVDALEQYSKELEKQSI
jgi:hypothetical protein